MTLSFFALNEIILFLFLVVRLGAIMLALPFFGSRSVPGHLKILLIFLLSFSLYPVVQGQRTVILQGVMHLGMLILGEVFIGLIIGFVVQALFIGVQLSGELMNQQMGLSLATIFDPQNGRQSSVIANFQYVLAVLIFFSMHAHHWFVQAMAESLHRIPLLEFTVSTKVVTALITFVADAFIVAIKIASPVLVTLLLTIIAMGMVARLVPQMNVFILSFPTNFGIGVLILGFALPYFLGGFRSMFGQLGRNLFLVIRLLGER